MYIFQEELKKELSKLNIHEIDHDKVKIYICCPEDGYIDLCLRYSKESVFFDFSQTYPPIFDLLNWLEVIISDQRNSPLWIDIGYKEYSLNIITCKDVNKVVFEFAASNYQEITKIKRILVDQKELILEFYLILKYFNEIDLEYEDNRREGSRIFFDYERENDDDYIKLDLSKLEKYLNLYR